ncbi:Tox-REase-5 domain-containing protein [Micromonospora sp. NPDC047738]|uniref:Tox-REase-5 domain-containing protein n=1 Tax=Micromonospora sp. NPDC047738 TaxID=3155741 RepID=UPI0033F6BC2D
MAGTAAVLVLALCAGLAVALFRLADDRPGPADDGSKEAAALLYEAAGTLFDSGAERYRGMLTSYSGARVRIDARVTQEGTTLSTVEVSGGRGEVLDLGTNGTYAKGDRVFWAATDVPRLESLKYGSAWVRVAPDALGFDARELTPAAVAYSLAPGMEDGQGPPPGLRATLGDVTTINGVKVRPVLIPGAVVSITVGQPRRIVRIESDGTGTPTAVRTIGYTGSDGRSRGYRLAAGADNWLGVDLSGLSPEEIEDFFQAVKKRVTELAGAFDSQVTFDLEGDGTLGPCQQTSCVATYRLSNRVRLHSQYLRNDGPVYAAVTIRMTLDGRPLETCRPIISMPPNKSGTARCTATYTLPRSRNPKTYTVRASFKAEARAVIKADIERMTKDVARQEAARRRRPAPVTSTPVTPGSSRPTPRPSPSRTHPCEEPSLGRGPAGPGEWIRRNAGPPREWMRYQEQVTGLRRPHEYRYAGRDFDGFRMINGKPVFIEAKGRYDFLLWAAEVDKKTGRVRFLDEDPKLASLTPEQQKAIVDGSKRARAKLDELANQLIEQLARVRQVENGRLRYVVMEPKALAKIRAFVEPRLDAEDKALLDWESEPLDPDFGGCL